ncbi:50S ribosomal protein L4 [Salisediminibacterium halotolerans]|uniref:Large ribosomal subunit protein uL4 n=1 Tax=Salisediminibacterium halotolerans TaxID=517425 RepID=A0A1H9UQ00_9BACI|nr:MULTISPECIES: 50S ribosomal protein L4 [Salisediminibacterium]RLJ73077.1 LSU ribosomal protein L4P [Actinophytocola xinjiangensis]RPE86499.1 LSU ribosomal protein L4P [Salisediminibacterium halotolerans]TWG33874.1 LSU ribosomal protein L4P [Salisediminibacterium halotolerans]SES11418.1 large subunit ribosomal protein L4 [Salisediminibacterium haloalkalitolerans]GEL07467.1 50S ribosomal protein L4 [Salisediminibacterium halotolerans]
MPKVTMYNQAGSQVGEIELSDNVFGVEPNESVLYEAVIMQQASKRQGTHSVKGRSDVSGGGAKPWRQKGTGRARHGSIRSPIWVGGGVAFGPTPRKYGFKMPKKQRRLALKSAFSTKVNDDAVCVLDELSLEAPKTKAMKEILKGLSAEEKTLIVTDSFNSNVALSAQNLPNVKYLTADGVNVLDLLHNDKVLITQDAVKQVEEVLA